MSGVRLGDCARGGDATICGSSPGPLKSSPLDREAPRPSSRQHVAQTSVKRSERLFLCATSWRWPTAGTPLPSVALVEGTGTSQVVSRVAGQAIPACVI